MNYNNQYYGGESSVICPNCGSQNGGGDAVCRNCGYQLKAQQPQYQQPQYQQTGYPVQNGVDAADVQQNKVMAVLAYFGILVLIPIFSAKNSRFARFHANQGLVLWLAGIVWSIATSILNTVVAAISYELAAVVSALLSLVSLVFLVFAILGIINACKGEEKELPLIGQFRLLK